MQKEIVCKLQKFLSKLVIKGASTFYDLKAAFITLGKDVCQALAFFHAFTNCDTVSSFFGIGKCKAWDQWFQSDDKDKITNVFRALGNKPVEVTSTDMSVIERYLVSFYISSKGKFPTKDLNSLRLVKFKTSTTNDLRTLPPSKGALIEHTKRACFQAGYLWRECIENLIIPSPLN